MNKLILFLLEHISPETQAKIIFLVSTIIIGLLVNIMAAAIMRFFLKW